MDKKDKERRSDKTNKKSVLISDHPVFSRVKGDLPARNKHKHSSRNPWVQKYFNIDARYKVTPKLVIFGVAVFLSFFIFREITDPFLDYREGQIAQRRLIAQRTTEFPDHETTEEKRREAIASVLPVYDYDHRAIVQSIQNLRNAFRRVRSTFPDVWKGKKKAYQEAVSSSAFETELFKKSKKLFSQMLEIDMTNEEFMAFMRLRFSYNLERTLIHLFAPVESKLIVLSKEILDSGQSRGITINHINEPFAEPREEIYKNLSEIVDIKTARAGLIVSGKQVFLSNRRDLELTALNVVSRLLIPNLTFNKKVTEERKNAAKDSIQPVIIKIAKGDTIINYHDTITKRHLVILSQLESLRSVESSHFRFLFTTVLLTVLLYLLFTFQRGGFEPYRYSLKDVAVLLLLGIGAIITMKGVQSIALEALLERLPQWPLEFYYFLVPTAAGPAIVRMITQKQAALLMTIVMAVVGGILLERNFFYACYVISSSLTAVIYATRIETRARIYKLGIVTGLVNVVMITCIAAFGRNGANMALLWQDLTWIVTAGMVSGILTAACVLSFVPLIEWAFGHTTDLRLLELAAMNHPLLRDLMVKAPGTYHHSIIIGSLVEKAAEAIEANPLLARVMAYYHDVGKMERPMYFIENQAGGYNRHDALQPHMSAMIIREHVKKGQELGYKHRLPQPVIDAMSEHHGSSVITYFYNKAKSMAEDPDSVLEADYQYDGKKPQSKESALIMLGDVVEAATRSLADPTPLRLSNVVRNVLNKYFAEGHLSECNLTLRDLDLIAESFVEVLIGIYHARIDYGISVTRDTIQRKKPNAAADSKSSSGQPNAQKQASGPNVKHITEAVRPTGTGSNGSKKG